MSPFLNLFFETFLVKLTGVDAPPLVDPLYWHGRAPIIGYWALGITATISWIAALCWIVYVIRVSRQESIEEHKLP